MQIHLFKNGLRRMAAAVLSACLLAGAAAAALDTAPKTDYLPILMYHHFDENPGDSKMIVSPKRFEEHMDALKKAGYTAVTPQQIVDYVDNGAPLPEKPVWISMDDGYQSNLDVAAPILARNGMNATIYCIGVSVGKSTYKEMGAPIIPHFPYDAAKRWYDMGVINIQSHTYDMHNVWSLDAANYRRGVLPRQEESLPTYIETFLADFQRSNDGIRKAFGYDSLAFAYPFGLNNAIIEGLLQMLGVRLTVTIREDINTLRQGDPSCLYGMARFNITDDVTGEALLHKIQEPVNVPA